MPRPRLLDLFCGAGGAGMGYHRAGFDVVGVDIKPQPRYPFEFHQADAMTFPLDGFDAVHASPPCQAHSTLRHRTRREYPNLIPETRERLVSSGLPYVIENVESAPLRNPLTLCGTEFGLQVEGRWLRRHRLLESNVFLPGAGGCNCSGRRIGGVYGTGGGGPMTRGWKFRPDQARVAMGIDWMSTAELAQAIPPAYTEHVGGFLLAALSLEVS